MSEPTPDDHTIDADPTALDRIRELAAAAESDANSEREQPVERDGDRDHQADRDDRTIDADPAALDQLQRFAHDADDRTGQRHGDDGENGDQTIDADPAALGHLRRRAQESGGPRQSTASRPMPRRAIPDVEAVPPARPVREGAVAEPWRPPARSMRPERAVDAPTDHGARWRLVSIVLAAVLLVVIGWLVFGGGEQAVDESPPEVPTATTPSDSTPATPATDSLDGDG